MSKRKHRKVTKSASAMNMVSGMEAVCKEKLRAFATGAEAKSSGGGNVLEPDRKYKDKLFRFLFNSRRELLNLYNAVNGTDYTNEEELEIVTLENAVYMNMKNDLAFVIDCYLNLYEHQSTKNPNMPLRYLFYVSAEYSKIIENKKASLYSSAQVKIPTPRFITFYNGTDEMPEKYMLKLSDAFEQEAGEPQLELLVTVLNINTGKNRKLVEKCRMLKEYVIYVGKVREYARDLTIKDAVEKTVNECIAEGVLKDILIKFRAEVIAMSIFEYDEERELEKLRKAEYDVGVEKGRNEGMEIGRSEGVKIGRSEGIKVMLETLKELEFSREDALSKLKEKFKLSGEEALKYMDMYWK